MTLTKEELARHRIHKAEAAPEFDDDAVSTCIHCHHEIRKVIGGQGPMWAHAGGFIIGEGPPK